MFGSSRKGLGLAGDERGATVVEFAIVAPVMLMMLFGIFQFGWMQHSLSNVRHAVDRASRALVLDPELTQPALQTIVTSHLAGTANPDVTVTLTKAEVDGGEIANLSTAYVVEFGVPGLATFSVPYKVNVTTVLRVAP